MQINEFRLRSLIKGLLLKEATDYKQYSNKGIPKGAIKKIQEITKTITIHTAVKPKVKIAVLVAHEPSVKEVFKKLKAESFGFFGVDNKKVKDFISTIESAVNSSGRKIIKFKEAGIGSIHSGVQIEERLIILMNAGMISSAKIMDKARELEPKYTEVKVGNKTITRSIYGDTIKHDAIIPKIKAKDKEEEKVDGDSAKAKPKKKSTSSNSVKKLQKLIGHSPANGVWSGTDKSWAAWCDKTLTDFSDDDLKLVKSSWKKYANQTDRKPTLSGMIEFVKDKNLIIQEEQDDQVSQWRKGLEKVYGSDDRLSDILQQFDNYISKGYAPSTASNAIKRSYGRALGESPRP